MEPKKTSLIACSQCGRQVSLNAKTCPECGHPVFPSLPGLSKRTLLKAVLVGIALILIIAAVRSRSSEQPAPITTHRDSPPATVQPVAAAVSGDPATELCSAIRAGNLNDVLKALSAGAPVNNASCNFATPLHDAAFWAEDANIVTALLARGAWVDSTDKFGQRTPLLLAIERTGLPPRSYAARLDIATRLLKAGANPDPRFLIGISGLMRAVEDGDLEMVLLLLRHGADVNLRGPGGLTALSLAHQTGNEEVVRALRQFGAKD